MGRKKTKVDIAVKYRQESSNRVISIEVKAPQDLFELSDLLAGEGIIQGLEQELSSGTRELITSYAKRGPEVLRNIPKNES